MSYTKITNFAIKDTYLTGNPAKIVKGAEIDAEFDNIATASAIAVEGPASAIDNEIARFDGITGKLIKAGLSYQTSTTDRTGNLMINGAFGLGTLGNIPNTGNMDAMLPTGFYKFANGVDTGTLPSGATNGVVQSETFTTAISRQTFYAVNGAADITSIFTRQIRGTTTIGPWTQLITGSTGLGSFKSASIIATSTTLTASDAGMLYLFFAGSTRTTTLPLYSAVPLGTNIRIFNNTSLPQTIQRQGSNTISWAKDPAATTSISIPAGCFIDISTTTAPDIWAVVADNVALGNGQSWTDVTASRALSTTYTNSTGKPIQVMVGGSGTPTNTVVPTVAGLALPTHQASATGSNQRMVCSFIVPTDATYSVAMSAGYLLTWSELR